MNVKSVLLAAAMLVCMLSAQGKDGDSGSGSGSSGSGSSGSSGSESTRDGGGTWSSNSSRSSDPVLVSVWSAIDKKDWARAQALLGAALANNSGDPTYHSLYADVIRNGPRPYDMDLVLWHYAQALRIDSGLGGAHRHIGQAYLGVRDLPKAKEHLAALGRICFFGCKELTELRRTVELFEVGQKQ